MVNIYSLVDISMTEKALKSVAKGMTINKKDNMIVSGSNMILDKTHLKLR